METYHFCTIAGNDYVFKVLALYDSLKKNSKEFHLWICCLDDISLQLLIRMDLTNVTLIPLGSIETEELLSVKNSRTIPEYSWTLKAPLVLYILNNYDFVNSIIYTDADLYFFSDPKHIYNQWGEGSIFICEQQLLDKKIDTGTYQSGLIGFKRDSNAIECLEWWKMKCLEWCFHWHEGDAWGDQKYLDKWPELFQGVIVSKDSGTHVGPWNVGHHESISEISVSNGEVYINNQKLVVYHFTGFVILSKVKFDLCNWWKVKNNIINPVYIPYIRSLRGAIKKVRQLDEHFTYGFAKRKKRKKITHYFKYTKNSNSHS